MKKTKIALGTDDGKTLSNDHFGSAKFFLIYELDLRNGNVAFVKKIKNTTPKEKKHGDPRKAKSVGQLLRDVSVLIGFVMGPNIVRIRKKFLPVISREKEIKKVLEKLPQFLDQISKEVSKKPGEDRKIIYIEAK